MKTLTLLLCLLALSLRAEESRHRVFGLSDPGRELDLREQLKSVPELELAALDLETAVATFRYDVTKLLPAAKSPPTAEAIAKRLDELVQKASKNPVSGHVTFSLKPRSSVPKDRLQKIEIQAPLLDCKGCRYTAYLACAKLDGVENVIVSETSLVTAWIDATKTNREALIAAMKKVRIEFPTP
ncbi:MAG: hypothetical protein NTX35_03450 [Verrucomicrobia bacterium]|jgi:hypothetical protein|nr:hypothetical protein [Verrucomicrobiota bacterium]